jgi:branched-chain amino acid transport system ATP-binding protein
VRQGLVQVPEGREVFPLLTVRENLLMGAYTRPTGRVAKRHRGMSTPTSPSSRSAATSRRPALRRPAADAGDQPRPAGQAPTMMLLDEPSLGLSPKLTKEIFEIVIRINRERGVTLLVVEQNANIALKYADYGYVLEIGRIVMHDTCAALREKEDIKEFYLGAKEAGVREGGAGRRRRHGDEATPCARSPAG